jgi:transcriptional regulator with XRE-family HTH domain
MRTFKIETSSFADIVRKICEETPILPKYFADQCGLHKSTISNLLNLKLKSVGFKTVKKIADATGHKFRLELIDKNKNLYKVTFIKADVSQNSYQESTLIDLKYELQQILFALDEEDLLSLREILRQMKQGKFNVHERENHPEVIER